MISENPSIREGRFAGNLYRVVKKYKGIFARNVLRNHVIKEERREERALQAILVCNEKKRRQTGHGAGGGREKNH